MGAAVADHGGKPLVDAALVLLGALVRVELDDGLAQELRPEELLALDTALQRLGEIDPARRELVELRFFAGLDYAELVPLLGRSERPLKREWAAARAALQAMMA